MVWCLSQLLGNSYKPSRKSKKIHRQEPNLILKKSPFSSLSSFACQVFQFFFLSNKKKEKNTLLIVLPKPGGTTLLPCTVLPHLEPHANVFPFFLFCLAMLQICSFQHKIQSPKKKKKEKNPPLIWVCVLWYITLNLHISYVAIWYMKGTLPHRRLSAYPEKKICITIWLSKTAKSHKRPMEGSFVWTTNFSNFSSILTSSPYIWKSRFLVKIWREKAKSNSNRWTRIVADGNQSWRNAIKKKGVRRGKSPQLNDFAPKNSCHTSFDSILLPLQHAFIHQYPQQNISGGYRTKGPSFYANFKIKKNVIFCATPKNFFFYLWPWKIRRCYFLPLYETYTYI